MVVQQIYLFIWNDAQENGLLAADMYLNQLRSHEVSGN